MSYKNVSYVGIALLVVGALLVASAEAVLVPPSGNIIWLDAEDPNGDGSAGPADGTPLAFWADKSGIATPNDYTSYGEDPLYQNGVLNGNAVLRHNGSQGLVSPWSLEYGAWTNFAVVKADPGSNFLWERFGKDNLGMTSGLPGGAATTLLTVRVCCDGGVGISNAALDWGNTGVFQVVEASYGGTLATSKLFQDGTAVSLEHSGSDGGIGIAGMQMRLGQRPFAGGGGLIGDIAEFLMFDRTLTENERNTVGLYLADRYGVSTTYVPEPGTLTLLGAGLFGLLAYARRKRK